MQNVPAPFAKDVLFCGNRHDASHPPMVYSFLRKQRLHRRADDKRQPIIAGFLVCKRMLADNGADMGLTRGSNERYDRTRQPHPHPHPQRRLARPRVLMSAAGAAMVLLAALASGVGAGCDDPGTRADATRRHAPPPTQPAVKPPTRPARGALAQSPQPAVSAYMKVYYAKSATPAEGLATVESDDTLEGTLQFPPARLRLTIKADEPAMGMLFSDDPKEAIDKGWTGDRFYFQLPLQHVSDLAQLDGAEWGCVSNLSAADREETSNGIFLRGDRYHLEPVNANIHFDGKAPHVQVTIAGQFLQYDSANPTAPPTPVYVNGLLAPRVESKD